MRVYRSAGAGQVTRRWNPASLLTAVPLRCPNVTDGALREIGRRCRELQVLDLTNTMRITDRGVRELTLGASTTCLKELSLWNCSQLTDSSIQVATASYSCLCNHCC